MQSVKMYLVKNTGGARVSRESDIIKLCTSSQVKSFLFPLRNRSNCRRVILCTLLYNNKNPYRHKTHLLYFTIVFISPIPAFLGLMWAAALVSIVNIVDSLFIVNVQVLKETNAC